MITNILDVDIDSFSLKYTNYKIIMVWSSEGMSTVWKL